MGVQTTPSFDVVHLDAKDFVTGIASPIDPKFVKYWLDRGLDRRIVLLLFFSAAEIVETNAKGQTTTIRIMNDPRAAIDVIRQSSFGNSADARRTEMRQRIGFQRYLKLINSLKTFFANSYTERRLLAENISVNDIKDLEVIAESDPTKFQWTSKGGTYDLYAVSGNQQIALCIADSGGVLLVDAGTSASVTKEAAIDRSWMLREIQVNPPQAECQRRTRARLLQRSPPATARNTTDLSIRATSKDLRTSPLRKSTPNSVGRRDHPVSGRSA